MTVRRCEARNARGEQCGIQEGHDGDHTALIESRFLTPLASAACPICGVDTPHHHDAPPAPLCVVCGKVESEHQLERHDFHSTLLTYPPASPDLDAKTLSVNEVNQILDYASRAMMQEIVRLHTEIIGLRAATSLPLTPRDSTP